MPTKCCAGAVQELPRMVGTETVYSSRVSVSWGARAKGESARPNGTVRRRCEVTAGDVNFRPALLKTPP